MPNSTYRDVHCVVHKRNVVQHTTVMVLAFLLCGCQGSRETEVSGKLAALSADTPPSSTLGAARKLLLQVTPNARCILSAAGDSADTLALDSDDRGILQFYYAPLGDVSTAPPTVLQCTSEAGESTTQSLAMADILAGQSALQAARLPSPTATLRPAITGDPNAWSQTDLIAHGYPPRPDPIASPDAYALWLTHVSVPLTLVKAHLINHPGITHATITAQNNSIWSGSVLDGASHPYVEAEAHIWVPQITPTSLGEASFWVGLGGLEGNSLVQGGFMLQQIAFGHGYVTSYYPWVEWAATGTSESEINNFALSPNDEVFLVSWVGDSAGNVTASGTLAWLEIVDDTTGVGTFATQGRPSGATFDGSTAEWIVERPQYCSWFFGWSCSIDVLVDYSAVLIQNVAAAASDAPYGFSHNITTDNSLLFTMTNNSNQILSIPFWSGSNLIVEWSRSQ